MKTLNLSQISLRKLTRRSLFLIIIAALVMMSAGAAAYSHNRASNRAAEQAELKKIAATKAKEWKRASAVDSKRSGPPEQAATSKAPPKKPSTTPAKKPTTTAPAPAPVVTPPSAPIVNTTNCLPPDASKWDKMPSHLSNSEFMLSGYYQETPKFVEALEFAGLLGTANGKKTVVFTVSDGAFNNLSAEQQAWLYASPENMKSVIGWHVVQSCIIWKDIRNATMNVTFDTLNGTVTYVLGENGSHRGTINGQYIGIWDWFTSNGAVHYLSGFIVAPST